MKVFHDFRCGAGHVTEHYVSSEDTCVRCPQCSSPAQRVFLQAPRLDWAGMAQGENAGPEFIDRFEKVHKKEKERQERIHLEHGDYGPGYASPVTSTSYSTPIPSGTVGGDHTHVNRDR